MLRGEARGDARGEVRGERPLGDEDTLGLRLSSLRISSSIMLSDDVRRLPRLLPASSRGSTSIRVGMLGTCGTRVLGLRRRSSKAAIISAHASSAVFELSSTSAGHERLRFIAFVCLRLETCD